MDRTKFQSLIRRILTEEVEKRSMTDKLIYKRVPEVVHDKDYRKEKLSPQERDDKSKDELLDDIAKVVKAINSDFTVVWDDHDDISISARDLFRIRIIPKWEDNYSIEAFTRNEDRVFITGQHWDQVKEFVKDNLKDAETCVDKAYGKVVKNQEDQVSAADKSLSQKDKPKTLPLTNEPPKSTKNKDKNYSEEDVKNEDDLPEKPMKEVGEVKKQIDHKTKEPVKLRKKHDNDKHIVKN